MQWGAVAGLAENPGATSGPHPSVNAEHPWGMKWPSSTVTGKPVTPLPHKRMSATDMRELAELELVT